jgi:arylsulfatase A-like enzyme
MRALITTHRKNHPDQPFFAVLSTQIAHAPMLSAPEFAGATKAGPRGDFVHQLDVPVGRLIDLLKENGIDDETLVLFHADNGAETRHVVWMRGDHNHDAVGGWRGMKRDGWEGGHRVPFIARWPLKTPPQQVTAQMMNTTDTFLDLAGLPAHPVMHGVSFKPLALGNKPVGWRSSFLCYYSKDLGPTPTCRGIRTENAKLIVYKDKPEWTSVYDLQNDPYELNSLPADGPLAKQLSAELEQDESSRLHPINPRSHRNENHESTPIHIDSPLQQSHQTQVDYENKNQTRHCRDCRFPGSGPHFPM